MKALSLFVVRRCSPASHFFFLALPVLLLAGAATQAGAQEQESILFIVRKPGGTFSIHVMNGDGTGQKSLAEGKVNEVDPTWSPDRKKIAFVAIDLKKKTGDVVV